VAVRLWIVLLSALGLMLPPAGPAAAMPGDGLLAERVLAQAALDRGELTMGPGATVDRPAEGRAPSGPEYEREPATEALGDHLRTSEGVELLVGAGRLLTNGRPGVMSLADLDASAEVAPEARLVRGPAPWCDVVQCRLRTGARLLRWATAPPA